MKDHDFIKLHNTDIECQHCKVRLTGCNERDLRMLNERGRNERGRNSCYGSPEAERAGMIKLMKMRR